MKTGVITDGISRDVEYAFQVMNNAGISHAELQFVWDKEIGDQSASEIDRLKKLTEKYNITVSCISRHNFTNFRVFETDLKSVEYSREIDYLKKCIEIGKIMGTRNIRVMVCKKEVNIWGHGGAEQWLTTNNGAWDRFLDIFREPVRIAEEADIDLVAENGNDGMITSGYLARKFVDDLGSPNVKILWDPANSIVGGDAPFPDGYNEIKNCIAEIHIKDLKSDRIRSTVEFCQLGHGDFGPMLPELADALRTDGFDGVVVLESVYRPEGKSFEDGFHASVRYFKSLFE